MKKLIIGVLIISTTTAWAQSFDGLTGNFELMDKDSNIGECVEELKLSVSDRRIGEVLVVEQHDLPEYTSGHSVSYLMDFNFNDTSKRKIRFANYQRDENTMDKDMRMTKHLYGLGKVKRAQRFYLDFSQLTEEGILTTVHVKRRNITERCSYKVL